MRKHYLVGALAVVTANCAFAQPAFTDASSLLSDITHSGNCTGVTDMNGDGLDDIATLDDGRRLVVYYQQADGTFQRHDYGAIASENQWGFALGDTDNDGHKDLVAGGSYDGVHYLRISAQGVAQAVNDLDNSDMFMQCTNIADVDNNGWLDAFGCHDDGAPRIWTNDGAGDLGFEDMIDFSSNPASDMSGNYGSVWTDFDNDGDLDLYIAKCRQGHNDPEDVLRWDRLFVNDGNNNYTDQAAAFGVENRWQTWSVDFGDIDNDGDMDLVATNHDNTMQLFENDGTGHFTEITAGSGLQVSGFFLQSHFEDFDNDGFLDILIGGMGTEYYFTNDGDKTFTQNSFPIEGDKALHSFGIGDLNNDGFPDVFASYADGYVDPDDGVSDRLWLNTPNANHWFNVVLQGTVSNRDAVGARVTLTTALGTQIREVRSGESYGIVNSFSCHFGLGANTTIETLNIRWPSGLVETWDNLDADQVVSVIEGECISANASISADGPAVICGSGSVVLSAPAGFSYLWNNGTTGQDLTVDQGGVYMVRLDAGGECVGYAGITVLQDPDETPSIEASGDVTFCASEEVTLTSSPAASYVWSTGAQTQSITVSSPGNYSVTIEGACEEFTSETVEVEVLAVPMAPTSSDVSIPAPGTAELTASGTNVRWYDAASGGTLVGTGSPWTTPLLMDNTTFWAADANAYGGGTLFGGRTNRTSQGAYHNNNNFNLVFEAYETMVLKSVKIYANGAGSKTVELVNASGVVMASVTADVPTGESRIQLDMEVTAGSYGLRSGDSNPQLWRDQQGSALPYPFLLGELGAITGTSVTGSNQYNNYYFFYDWEVEGLPTYCEGERTEVEVSVGPVGVQDEVGNTGLHVYPNPADELLTIAFGPLTGTVQAELMDVTGRVVRTQRLDNASGVAQMDLSGIAAGERNPSERARLRARSFFRPPPR
jgi:hypothetical protein